MPPRRRRNADGSLTGGTGDVNPQFYSTSVTESANDTTTTLAVQSPPGIGLSTSGKPLAMELLRVWVEFEAGTAPFSPTSAEFAPGATTASNAYVRVIGSSKNFSTTYPSLSMGDATVFFYARKNLIIYESTAASTLAVSDDGPFQIDLTDGAGHGILYANQNIYLQVSSASTGGTIIARLKFLYREKYITEAELLGLVLQSNQN